MADCMEVGEGIGGTTLLCDRRKEHDGNHHCPLTGATWGRSLSLTNGADVSGDRQRRYLLDAASILAAFVLTGMLWTGASSWLTGAAGYGLGVAATLRAVSRQARA